MPVTSINQSNSDIIDNNIMDTDNSMIYASYLQQTNNTPRNTSSTSTNSINIIQSNRNRTNNNIDNSSKNNFMYF